jgi:hypothetical protein
MERGLSASPKATDGVEFHVVELCLVVAGKHRLPDQSRSLPVVISDVNGLDGFERQMPVEILQLMGGRSDTVPRGHVEMFPRSTEVR